MTNVKMRFLTGLTFLSICFAAIKPSAADDQAGRDYFEKNVRPLLVKHCYECHSQKAKKQKGGLRLDVRSGWQTGGESGPAIIPGKPEESLLVASVRYESFEMPPKGKLTPAEIRIFERWVSMGAPDPRDGTISVPESKINFEEARRFWAFQPPVRHEPPRVENVDWPRSPIDRFLLAKLEAAALSPSADASPRDWLRRVTFDLTGLPPTVKESAGFLAEFENAPDAARRQVVDRLLATPQFGEQWGRHWLDLARYADSNGGDINLTYFNAWRYRDYVVNSINSDKPFDEFAREQIAGDLLPTESTSQKADQLIATGFLIIGPKMLSERNKEKLFMDVADEQIDTIGRVFLGMTIGCARCHDHKFDPIPVTDYYALAGMFRSTETIYGIRMGNVNVSGWLEQPLPVSPEQAARIADHDQLTAEIKAQVAVLKKQLAELNVSATPKASLLSGIVVDDAQAQLEGAWKKSTFSKHYVDAGYIHDDKMDLGKKSVTFTPEIPEAGEYEVRISYPGSNGRASNVPVLVMSADGAKEIVVDQTKPAPINGLFRSLGTFRFEAGRTGFVRISNANANGYVIADAAQFLPAGSSEKPAASKETTALAAKLTKELKVVEARLKELQKSAPEKPMAMAVRDRETVADSEIRIRGIADHRGAVIPRGFLTVASHPDSPEIDKTQSGRAELARWISAPSNPLFARVIVNRVWMHLMGQGIVRSVDNFGRLGDTPSHPELLDTLAVDFMSEGWSIKRLVRKIVLSRAYGISSASSEAAIATDPENRLWARQNRRRLPAESIRDSMLAMSGRLDRTTGGSTVKGMGEQAVANNPADQKSRAAGGPLRRSLYLPIIRNDLPPFLTVFDFADPDVVTGRRAVTNVPAQALLMLNSPFVRECAAAMGEEVVAQNELKSDADRVGWIYRTMLNRPASQDEVDRATRFLRSSLTKDAEITADQWSLLCQTIFATSEFQILN
jgi:cytochrome c553